VIGYYVHHQGRGHLTRMRCVTERVARPVTVLSSLPPGPGEQRPWVTLARDDTCEHPEDVTAGGALHWVPRHDAGLAQRSARVAGWIAETRPQLLVVDVSVEITALARLCGTPVVVMAMPGERRDRAHALAYDIADALLAPWPPGLHTGWPERWTEKTVFLGGVSRFDDWPGARTRRSRRAGRRRGLVLWGSGGDDLGPRVLRSLRAGTPDWTWETAGLEGRQLDATATWGALRDAELVVTHGGQNAIADVAAAQVPGVVVADDRPFGEQHRTVGWLADLELAATATGCPPPEAWHSLLTRATSLDTRRWALWNDGEGAGRAARALEGLSHEPAGRAAS
jgi:hypothetical protein